MFFLKSSAENCDKWLCASSAMECSVIMMLAFFPEKNLLVESWTPVQRVYAVVSLCHFGIL